MKKITQRDAVIEVMMNNGGYATLKFLYENTLKVPGVEWKTKTPYESIRRIVQEEKYFFKIKPGLWALLEYRGKLPQSVSGLINEKDNGEEDNNNTHYYYQGLIVDIGNMKGLDTYVPDQDKNRSYLNQKLQDITTIKEVPYFTYPETINRIKSADVIWINEDKYPQRVIEVEFTTNFKNALLKFGELKYFTTEMFIAADKCREKQFQEAIKFKAFNNIRNRVKFWSFDSIVNYHSKLAEIKLIDNT